MRTCRALNAVVIVLAVSAIGAGPTGGGPTGGGTVVGPGWTIATSSDSESYQSPVSSIAVAGSHSPEGVSAYVCKIRKHGNTTVTGSTAGNCTADGSWSGNVTFGNAPQPNMYDALVYAAGSSMPDDYRVFYIVE